MAVRLGKKKITLRHVVLGFLIPLCIIGYLVGIFLIFKAVWTPGDNASRYGASALWTLVLSVIATAVAIFAEEEME